ncbi:MAG: hypothetical protein ACFFDP_06005 [Promethearchaeota archaeon]
MRIESDWLQTLVEYFTTVRDYYENHYTKTVVDEMSELCKEFIPKDKSMALPSKLVEGERLWLENLLESISVVGRTLTNLEHWRDWSTALIFDLKLATSDIPLLARGEKTAFQRIQAQGLEEGFVRWILGTAITDFIDIIAETKELLTQIMSLQSFGHQLNSPWLLFICRAFGQLQEQRHEKQLEDLQKALNDAYYATDHDTRLRNLATFLYLYTKWQLDLAPEGVEVNDPRWILKMIENAGGQVDRLKILTQRLRTLLKTRNAIYYYFEQAELSVIRMMLGYGGNPQQWWHTFITSPASEIPKIIPKNINLKELLIGVSHSLSLHEDLEHHLIPQSPVFIATFKQIAELLQSESFTNYCQTIEYRISIWDQYRTRWNRLLTQLQRELQHQEQIAQVRAE